MSQNIAGKNQIYNFVFKFVDEDSVLPNGFTKNVKVHLERLSEKAIKSAEAPTNDQKTKLKKCPKCSEQFKWLPPLMKHIKDNHPELTICAFCNSVFNKESDFKTHSLKCKKPEGIVQCAKCNLLCKTEKTLAVHDMMKHQPVTCTICKKSVGNKLNLVRHQVKCKEINEVK